MTKSFSITLTGENHNRLSAHLTRSDGQEDVCFAFWRPSTGHDRLTAIVSEALLPLEGERDIRGTASFSGDYALRAARLAAEQRTGVALVHSHPRARRWQFAPDGSADAETERKLANLVREFTGQPLVGMTLSTKSQEWSGRIWNVGRGPAVSRTEAETARVIGPSLHVAYNPRLRPAPPVEDSQIRTLSAWGEESQAHLARLKVLVIGAGSVGQLLIEMLARTGVQNIGIMDFDTVELKNLDRLHGARRSDVWLHTSKAELGYRVAQQAATAHDFHPELLETSACDEEGLSLALDHDVIFCCVDRPWPRHVLNTIAYSDLLPVIDGGIRMEPHPKVGLRNAYWRSHVVGPGRTCIRCLGQYDVSDVQLERDGSLDDPAYIARLPGDSPLRVRQNVYAMSLAAASTMANQFLSLVIAPCGFGDPGGLRYNLRQPGVERVQHHCVEHCAYQEGVAEGDNRRDPTAPHAYAQRTMATRIKVRRSFQIRAVRAFLSSCDRLSNRKGRLATP